jgi:hypothetical protein
MPPTIAPFKAAAKQVAGKIITPTALGSKEIQALAPEIRVRAQFSAKVESARILDAIKKGMQDTLTLSKAEGGGVMTPDKMMLNIQRIAQAEGVYTGPKGTIQDIASVPRLRLVAEMNSKMATGYATWKQGQDQMLDLYPAQRFTRIEFREKPRDNWPQRWRDAAKSVDYEGVSKRGMVALKTSPIWETLSRFGTPWPPFDWGSGMGLEDVSFDDAVKLGLIAEGDTLEPLEDGFNNNLKTSVAGMAEDILAQLEAAFGDNAAVIDGDLVWGGELENRAGALQNFDPTDPNVTNRGR